MKSVYYIIISILFISLFLSCSSEKSYTGGKLITGPAASDIVNYVNQGILAIAELEEKSLESYASVTGKNYEIGIPTPAFKHGIGLKASL